jgi:hypothetical protein
MAGSLFDNHKFTIKTVNEIVVLYSGLLGEAAKL